MKYDLRYLYSIVWVLALLLPNTAALADDDPCGGIYPGGIAYTKRWAYLDTISPGKTQRLHLELAGAVDHDSLDGTTCTEGSTRSPNMVQPGITHWWSNSGIVDPPDGAETYWKPTEKGEGFLVRATVKDNPYQYYNDPDAYASITVGAYEVYVVQNLAAEGTGVPPITNPLFMHYASQEGVGCSSFSDFGSGCACSAVFAPAGGSDDFCAGKTTASWAFRVDPEAADCGPSLVKATQMILSAARKEIGVDDADASIGGEGAVGLSFGFTVGIDPLSFSIDITPNLFGNCDEGLGLTSWAYTVNGGTLGVPQNPDQTIFQKASNEVDDPMPGSYFCWELYAIDPIAYFQPTRFTDLLQLNTGCATNYLMPNSTMQAHLMTYAYATSHKEQTHGNGYADARFYDWTIMVMIRDVELYDPPTL